MVTQRKIKKTFKKEKIDNILNDLEIAKRELSHYPHHVLARALLGACKFILMMDPDNKFDPAGKDVEQVDDFKLISLSNDLASHVMASYLSNKNEIDSSLLRELH